MKRRSWEILTPHWDITATCNIFEILMPNGRYIMWEWDNNHKLIEKDIWHLF